MAFGPSRNSSKSLAATRSHITALRKDRGQLLGIQIDADSMTAIQAAPCSIHRER